MSQRGPSIHEASRRANLKRLMDLGIDPWGSRFDGHQPIGRVRAMKDQIRYRLADGQELALPPLEGPQRVDYRQWKSQQGPGEEVGPKVRVAGRIVLQRPTGKLIFLNIRDWTGDIQIFVGQRQVGHHNWQIAECLDLGDIIGVDGRLGRTNTGELTVFAEELHFLCKTLEPPPEKYHGLTDPELRQRLRYLDLLYTEGVLETFLKRTRIVQAIRRVLDEQGYIEVEGPTLHTIAGGAAARPFITHHNALDIDLYLRIALELHLKRLLVGGIEKVYELGRVYRNEGISPRHNPEFTMLEVYQAYGDYHTMMDLAEQIVLGSLRAIQDDYCVQWGETVIDFTPPFARRTYDELFQEHTGITPSDSKAVADFASRIGLHPQGKHPDVIKSEIFEEVVEPKLIGPVFVIDYPAALCPLTKRKRDNPQIAERFELFVQGMEIANAYTELNDPDLQEELFRTQLEGLPEEESMARMDHDFLRALRNGMPPAGGLGIGVDRLVMLLTGSRSIRDVILFPLLRPEAGAK
ncbi:MAG: lysine--tRNA ligase [Pirellulaceae bacterium]|nr:MAG: lysine--tRNA ligase [Pirellulaceae bacterium]